MSPIFEPKKEKRYWVESYYFAGGHAGRQEVLEGALNEMDDKGWRVAHVISHRDHVLVIYEREDVITASLITAEIASAPDQMTEVTRLLTELSKKLDVKGV